MLSGRNPEPTRSDLVARYVGLAVFSVLLLPWLALAIGCLLLGIVGIVRGETQLLIGLPAGIALLVAGPLLFYLDRRRYPPISSFEYADGVLRYTLSNGQAEHSRPRDDVRRVVCRRGRRRRSHRGYQVMFADRKWIFIPRDLPNADQLCDQLQAEVAARAALNEQHLQHH